MDKINPTLKIILYPIIFIVWAIKRLVYERYVDTPTFVEYWEEL